MNTIAKLARLSEALGPNIQPKDITIGDATETFYFRRIPYAEAQRIGAIPMTVDKDGKVSFDLAKVASREVATIAASVVDESGAPALTREQVAALDGPIAAKLHAAAVEVNALGEKAVETATKNSEPTGSADSSSS